MDNFANVEDSNTYDTYRYVNFYDNLDNYNVNSVEAGSRNSHHEHQESSSNLDTYSSTSQAGVGEGRYKTMMSGMMTDMIKSTVSTAVDTVMESGSAKVPVQFSHLKKRTTAKGGDDRVSHRVHTDEYPQLCLLLGLGAKVTNNQNRILKNHFKITISSFSRLLGAG